MRQGTRENLMNFNEVAKRFDNDELGDQQIDSLNQLLDFYVSQAARKRGTSVESQRRVFDIQQSKEQIMARLMSDIAAMDNPGTEIEPQSDAKVVSFNGDKYYVQTESGSQELGLGDIMVDGEWGIKYHLDGNVPRNVRKRFLIERAKRKLQHELDRQIIIDEGSSRFTDWAKRKTYQAIEADEAGGREHFGLVAEKMVRTFLTKLSYDYPEVNFEVEPSDVWQDVEKKIDFIIHRKRHHRGVNVEAADEADNKGIQFTVNTTEENLQKKADQIRRAKDHLVERDHVSDIMLVSLPMDKFVAAYRDWGAQGKPSGGPDKMWSREVKEEIFRNVMKGILSPEEIEEQWQIVAGQDQPENLAA